MDRPRARMADHGLVGRCRAGGPAAPEDWIELATGGTIRARAITALPASPACYSGECRPRPSWRPSWWPVGMPSAADPRSKRPSCAASWTASPTANGVAGGSTNDGRGPRRRRPPFAGQRRGVAGAEHAPLARSARPGCIPRGGRAGPARDRAAHRGRSVALLLQFLSAFGNACGRTHYVRIEGDQHPPQLWPLLVGETAKGRKGTSLGRILDLFALVDPDWTRERVLGGLSSGEGLIWQVRDPTTKRVKDKETGEFEDVQTDAGVEDKRLFVIETEFASVLRQIERQGNTLSAIMRGCGPWQRADLDQAPARQGHRGDHRHRRPRHRGRAETLSDPHGAGERAGQSLPVRLRQALEGPAVRRRGGRADPPGGGGRQAA